jgi:hypothetical protein
VETQANLLQIQECRAFRLQCLESFNTIQATERKNQRLTVISWLSSADANLDQEGSAAARRDYPRTCHWIFRKPEIKSWYDPDESLISQVWLNGIPGAGKVHDHPFR